MKKVTYMYHGTTLENAKDLASNGWNWAKNAPDSNWECSEPDKIYFWCGLSLSVAEERVSDVDEYEAGIDHDCDAIRHAFENAQIAAAVQNSQERMLVVLGYKAEYDDEGKEGENIAECLEEIWEQDCSCENMSGAYCADIRYLNGEKPDVVYFCKGYDPMVRGFLIPVDNDYINLAWLEPFEVDVVRACKRGDKDFSVGEEVLSWISDISGWAEATADDIPVKEVK